MNDLRKLEGEIKSKEAELASILPQFQSHKGKEERLSARLKACEQHRLELFAKEGRSLKFSSAEDRDTWLNREIMSLQQSAAQKEKQVREERERRERELRIVLYLRFYFSFSRFKTSSKQYLT